MIQEVKPVCMVAAAQQLLRREAGKAQTFIVGFREEVGGLGRNKW